MNIDSIDSCIKSSNWGSFVQAVKKVAEFDEETKLFKTPSLALKIGHSMKKKQYYRI